ncbi:hypothetical protein A9G39_07850 [Gilliamella sp. Imp1-6]|nr:hypothetical protein A9G39_07850 [Gilliamella apicola]
MAIPSGTTTTSLDTLIIQGKWGDDDGDGQGVNGVIGLGNISLTIQDKDGSAVNRGDALSVCKAPYKVTLSSSGGSLTTHYGLPKKSTFNGGVVEYYIKPDSSGSCYFLPSVMPNLLYGGTNNSSDDPRFAGPSNIWSPTKGFLVQSTSPSSYDQNFPTTGADGLYFNLGIDGLDASQLSWTVKTSGSLGATVSRVGSNTRVTLHGPRADSSQISSRNPSPLTRPSLPQTFELVGRDSNGNEVRYGFVLKQWFVHRNQKTNHSNQTAWCNSLGYRMPKVSDLTNAVCSGWEANSSCQGVASATPSSSNNVYKRHIGAGFFTEWGAMYGYADAGFAYGVYWASDYMNSYRFAVGGVSGTIDSSLASTSFYAVCTTP